MGMVIADAFELLGGQPAAFEHHLLRGVKEHLTGLGRGLAKQFVPGPLVKPNPGQGHESPDYQQHHQEHFQLNGASGHPGPSPCTAWSNFGAYSPAPVNAPHKPPAVLAYALQFLSGDRKQTQTLTGG